MTRLAQLQDGGGPDQRQGLTLQPLDRTSEDPACRPTAPALGSLFCFPSPSFEKPLPALRGEGRL